MGPERLRVGLPTEGHIDAARAAEVLGGGDAFQNQEQEVIGEQGKPVRHLDDTTYTTRATATGRAKQGTKRGRLAVNMISLTTA